MKKPQLALLATAIAMMGSTVWADVGTTPELDTPRRIETATAKIRGTDQNMTYMVIDGRAMLGDIMLGMHKDVQTNGINLPKLDLPKAAGDKLDSGRVVAKDNHYKSATSWTNNTMPYTFDPSLSKAKRDAIAVGMKLISDNTNIRFVPRTSETNYVKFVSDGGCWSYVGMIGKEQPISIGDGCERSGTVAHEIMHALGWMHEQMRPDRDNYVRVVEENIQDGMASQFTKLRADQVNPAGGYDIDSVMHYPNWAFSKNGKPTIVPLDPKVDPSRMGQRNQLSAADITAINKFYPAVNGNVPLTMTTSTSSVSFMQDKSGQFSLTLAGSDADLKSLRFDIRSDNSAVVAPAGVVVQAGTGTQRTVTITPVAKASGVATITLRAIAASGKEVTASVKVTVAKDTTGGGGGGTSTAKPYDRAAKYTTGNQVSFGGKTYSMTVMIDGKVSTTYWIWGSYCEPVRCSPQTPFVYSNWLKVYWTEVGGGDGGGTTPKPACETVLDVNRQYQITSSSQRKSLVPAGDVQNAPMMLWPDAGQQRWKLTRNAEGYYVIASAATGLALDVANGATLAGSEVIVWPVHGGANQQFCPRASGSGYQLVSRGANLPLAAASENDGAAVKLSSGAATWLLSPL
ncbi:hypothetical protein GCM10007907_10380 [Chitinimonas prasina]|uniref:Peptidase M12A domain-containing protein n=1 Tax=Chitinimonas prasina TaxID=1434937 RepID=A0ABQ5YF24_9NEIS|nr:M12 family metallopeptidase [Chitinimonas prasina]GLR12248.1 hypothetical protein GCM10007907_10380 [Chitinimonas prasina]